MASNTSDKSVNYPQIIKSSDQKFFEEEDLLKVAKVKELFLYPIKSCRGIKVPSADCTILGLKLGGFRDRGFMLVDNNGRFLACKQEPSMLKIAPKLYTLNEMWVNAPNKETLKIKLDELIQPDKKKITARIFEEDVVGIDCGPAINSWFSSYLNRDVKLLYHNDEEKPRYCKNRDKYAHMANNYDSVVYANITSYMLLSQSSVDDLDKKLTGRANIRRFRPNIVVEGNVPYSEDTWKFVRINNDVLLRFIKKCQRCFSVTVDPETGTKEKDGETYKFLTSYRKASDAKTKEYAGEQPLFGVNFGIDRVGKISVGDSVYAAVNTV